MPPALFAPWPAPIGAPQVPELPNVNVPPLIVISPMEELMPEPIADPAEPPFDVILYVPLLIVSGAALFLSPESVPIPPPVPAALVREPVPSTVKPPPTLMTALSPPPKTVLLPLMLRTLPDPLNFMAFCPAESEILTFSSQRLALPPEGPTI